jgi:hypothetical protein
MALDPSILRRIRLLIPDGEPVFGPGENEYLFSDQDVEDLYEEGFQNVKCAAGLAKISIGSSEALLLKVVKNYETSTNGAQLLREWTVAGEALYDKGLAEIADEDANEGMFEIVFPDFGVTRHPEGATHRDEYMGGWL